MGRINVTFPIFADSNVQPNIISAVKLHVVHSKKNTDVVQVCVCVYIHIYMCVYIRKISLHNICKGCYELRCCLQPKLDFFP